MRLIALFLLFQTFLFAKSPTEERTGVLKNAVILIIRHAEKPDEGHGLSADGKSRAKAYVSYFKNYTIDGRVLKLDSLFAAADSLQSHRSRLTLEYVSKAFDLPIDTGFSNREYQSLVHKIQSKSRGKTILISWHHGEIPALLRALGSDPGKVLPNGRWPGDVFGWVIQLRYDSAGHLMEARRINEQLMPADSK